MYELDGDKPLNGSQNDGFEELVCQLANKELIPNKKQFIRNGKPDTENLSKEEKSNLIYQEYEQTYLRLVNYIV